MRSSAASYARGAGGAAAAGMRGVGALPIAVGVDVEQLEASRATAVLALSDALRERQQLRRQLDEVTHERDELRYQLEQVTRAAATNTGDRDRLHGELRRCEHEHRVQMEQAAERIASLMSQLTSLEAANRNLSETIAAGEADNARVREQLERTTVRESREHASSEQLVFALRRQMAETESRLVDELSARDRDLQHLRATVQHSTDDVARANARADEARGALVAVQAELDAALQRAERAKAVAADDARRWEAERSTLLSRHGAAQARCDELERACAELGQQLAVRDAECKVLTQQMEAGHSVAETVIHEERTIRAMTEQQLSSLSRSRDETQRDLETLQRTVKQYEVMVRKLQVDARESERREGDLRRQLGELDRVRAEHQAVRGDAMQLSGELASCRQQLRATQDELEQALAGVEAARARAARFGQLLQQWVSAARVVQDEVLRQQTASREQAGQWSSQYVQMLQVIDGLLARSAGSTRYA